MITLHYDTMYCQGIIISVIAIHLTDALQLREFRLPLNLYIRRFWVFWDVDGQSDVIYVVVLIYIYNSITALRRKSLVFIINGDEDGMT